MAADFSSVCRELRIGSVHSAWRVCSTYVEGGPRREERSRIHAGFVLELVFETAQSLAVEHSSIRASLTSCS